MLEKNNTLAELDLRPCYFGDAGAIAIAQLLRENCALTSLRLSYLFPTIKKDDPPFSQEGIKALNEAFRVNSSLIDFEFDPLQFLCAQLLSSEKQYRLKATINSIFPADRYLEGNREIDRLVKSNVFPKSLAVIILNPDYRGMLYLLMVVSSSKKIEPMNPTQPNLLGSYTFPPDTWAHIFNFLMPNGAPPFTPGTLQQSGNIMALRYYNAMFSIAHAKSNYGYMDMRFSKFYNDVLSTNTQEYFDREIEKFLNPAIFGTQGKQARESQKQQKPFNPKRMSYQTGRSPANDTNSPTLYEGPGKRLQPDSDSQPHAKRQRINNQRFFVTPNQQDTKETEHKSLSLTPQNN